ncbi:unnamed protein product [Orchesella dallaii]
MDTTTSTIAMEDVCRSTYVSCIKVDGKPILPPIMTDERRQEMRRYKELAILKEKQLEEKKDSVIVTLTHKTFDTNAASEEADENQLAASGRRSVSTSPIRGVPVTSTPRIDRLHSATLIDVTNTLKSEDEVLKEENGVTVPNIEKVDSFSGSFNTSGVPEGVLRERKIVQQLDFNNSLSSANSGSSVALSYDGDEEKADGSGSSDNGSGDNFASAASSTGTFVIRRSEPAKVSQSEEVAGSQVATSDDDIENEENVPLTVLRKPSLEEPIFKRKRPAKYFDEADDGKLNSTTPKSSFPISTLPNSIPDLQSAENPLTGTLKFSPVANTNFSAMAKSLTNEFTQKFANLLASSSSKNSGQSYNVTLSKNIPSSADEQVADSDAVSNSSDKENINSLSKEDCRKHVRKLSYTLATPSAALLDAVSKDKNFAQTLETVPSAPSSNVPSAYQSPEKPTEVENINATLYEEVIDAPKLDRVNMKLQELHLGQGKQAHLQRFLGDQGLENTQVTESTDQVEVILKQMQKEHENKLQQLAEQHRLQELQIRKQFESDLEKLKEKLSSTLNTTGSSKSYKTSPTSLAESINLSTRSPRPHTATSTASLLLSEETMNCKKIPTSEMSGVSGLERTKSEATSIYQFTGNSGMSSSSTFVGLVGTTDLAGVGLSKLQSRMQLMSPSLFRVPADARSPLLKGLVFPDPLDKPRPPIRIPTKAFDASMKPKFDRLSAAVKGYLTRRLLHTEKVQIIVQTIRDTVDLLLRLYEEVPTIGSNHTVKPQDANLHQMLIQQLTGACQSFHDVFFKLSTKERMAIIATDREKSKAKALRNLSSPSRRNISNATLKSLERRMSHRLTSPKRDNKKYRGPEKSKDPLPHGSQSVKPKPVKNFNISPKRRRISYWDEKSVKRSTSTTFLAGKSDLNGNNFKTPMDSARSQTSLASSSRSTRSYYPPTVGSGSETFVVPSSTPTGRSVLTSSNNASKAQYSSSSARRDSSSRSVSARSTQSTVTTYSTTGRFKASLSKQPWK